MPNVYDYRTFNHPGGAKLIVVRGEDNKVRSFYNICPHRGNTLLYDPVGNAKRITCIFHAWSFDTKGDCIDISRGKQGYQDRYGCENAGLREVRAEVGFGGFVWVNIDDDACTLPEYIGDALGMLDEHLNMPLEVFHYHKAVVDTNYKLWHDTNSEFYHDYMHYFNRVTGMMQPGYFDRKYTGYPNGHASVGSMSIKYDAYEGSQARGVGWPGLAPGGWILIDIFPGMTYNLRTSVLRMDTAIPLGPNKVVIEFRGLGLKSDTPASSAPSASATTTPSGARSAATCTRTCSACTARAARCTTGSDSKWVIHGREENMTIHDEGRHAAFLCRVEQAHGPSGVRPLRRQPHRQADGGRVMGQDETAKLERGLNARDRDRRADLPREHLPRRQGLRRVTSQLCDEKFHYRITAHSPEIRKDMIWLEHDKKGMQLLFTNLPKHNSDHSPITRHATVYTVEVDAAGNEAKVVSALQVFRTTLDGGATELFAVGKHVRHRRAGRRRPEAARPAHPARYPHAGHRLPHPVLEPAERRP